MAAAHDIPLIATLGMGLGLAFVAGFVTTRLRLPALVGYLIAGVAIGPHTPGMVADASIASELSEIGVILLMFGVGTHFSLRDLWAVRRIALPGAIVQIAVATALGMAVAVGWWQWSIGAALVFGLALSVASTVVMLRALQDRGMLDSIDGRIAVGWLVVEDLAMVFALILLPAFAGSLGGTAQAVDTAGLATTLGYTALKIGAFFALMYGVGMRVFPWLFAELLRHGSRELLTLFVTAIAISITYAASTVFGVSFALGAFLAGVVVNEADLGKRIHAQIEVLEHVFTVLFFVAVGMLFDPSILWREPLQVLAVLAIIMIGKSLAALLLVLLLRYPLSSALTVSASLAQIGEFSFILAALGVSLGLLTQQAQDLILAGALLSITLNPLMFKAAALLAASRQQRKPVRASALPAPPLALDQHIILIGYGRVGRTIGKTLARAQLPFVVIEQARDVVDQLRKRDWRVILGDASRAEILQQAQPERARLVVIATPNAGEARRIFDIVKAANPALSVVVRIHSDEEAEYFDKRGADLALMAEKQLALAMADFVVERYRQHEA